MSDNDRAGSACMTLAEIFRRCSPAQLRDRKNDLLYRAGLVAGFGWDEFRHQWSTGEVLGTALVLNDINEIERSAETVDSALSRWAFDLWGLVDGQADLDSGLPATRAWLESVRSELLGGIAVNRPGE